MKGEHCPFFNPMYLESKCDECGRHVGVICANEGGNVCKACHLNPTPWARFILWVLNWTK